MTKQTINAIRLFSQTLSRITPVVKNLLCRKYCTTTKPKESRLYFPYSKKTSGKQENFSLSARVRTLTKPAILPQAESREPIPKYIYPHETQSKHMFVFVILFYHIKQRKSIVYVQNLVCLTIFFEALKNGGNVYSRR